MATKKSNNDAPEFDEPIIVKKKRPVHTPVAVYADLPGQPSPARSFAEMSEIEARRWINEPKKVPASYKVSPRLKEAFKQAVELKGLGNVNAALNAYMLDMVMECRDKIEI